MDTTRHELADKMDPTQHEHELTDKMDPTQVTTLTT